jgi:hypothetical protein
MDIFEPLKGYEEYYNINRNGEVYSKFKNRILIPYKQSIKNSNLKYLRLELQGKKYFIHRLLALQFLPNPNDYPIIDHIDRNTLNNNLNNLRWTTISVNRGNCDGWNKSGYKNIRITKSNTYEVSIYLNGKTIYDKSFKTLDEALSERDCAYDFYGIENNCYID